MRLGFVRTLVKTVGTTGGCAVLWVVAPQLAAGMSELWRLDPDAQSAVARNLVVILWASLILARMLSYLPLAMEARLRRDAALAESQPDLLPDHVRAVHEAGHAVVMHALGWAVTGVDIVPRAFDGGVTYGDPPPESRGARLAWERLVMRLAGTTAERVGGFESAGGLEDLRQALTQALVIMTLGSAPPGVDCALTVDGLIGAARETAERALLDNGDTFRAIVDALLAERRLGPERIAGLLAEPAPAPVGGR